VQDEHGNYPAVEFTNQNDVWDYITLVISESQQIQTQRGSCYDTLIDVYHQLPFFACVNMFLEEEHQKVIAQYIYCKDTGVQPFKGGYGDQPKLWVEKYGVIKSAINTLNNMKKE